MTPLAIQMMIHYHVSPTDYRGGDSSAPAVAEALSDFVARGLLEARVDGDARYEITDRGRAYVRGLTEMPLPRLRMQWVVGYPTIVLTAEGSEA